MKKAQSLHFDHVLTGHNSIDNRDNIVAKIANVSAKPTVTGCTRFRFQEKFKIKLSVTATSSFHSNCRRIC